MLILGWLYVTALAATGFVAGFRWRTPLCLAAFWWCVTAAFVNIGPTNDPDWLRGVWAPMEAISLAFSLVAITAAIFADTREIEPPRRFWLRFGACLLPISIVGMTWLNIHYETPYWTFLTLRSRLWQWAALALFIVWWLSPRTSRDTRFLLVIAAAHAVIGPMVRTSGLGEQAVYRSITIAACVWWISLGASRVAQPSLGQMHPDTCRVQPSAGQRS